MRSACEGNAIGPTSHVALATAKAHTLQRTLPRPNVHQAQHPGRSLALAAIPGEPPIKRSHPVIPGSSARAAPATPEPEQRDGGHGVATARHRMAHASTPSPATLSHPLTSPTPPRWDISSPSLAHPPLPNHQQHVRREVHPCGS